MKAMKNLADLIKDIDPDFTVLSTGQNGRVINKIEPGLIFGKLALYGILAGSLASFGLIMGKGMKMIANYSEEISRPFQVYSQDTSFWSNQRYIGGFDECEKIQNLMQCRNIGDKSPTQFNSRYTVERN